MDQRELTLLNIGQNLDDLSNLDPRGYGVCRILYEGARAYTKEPLTMNAAKQLVNTVKEGDLVYILTGFVLLPHKKAEMDGIVSSLLFARAIEKAFKAKPVIICPVDNVEAVKNVAPVIGLHLYETIEEVKEYPLSLGVIPFTKDAALAEEQADKIIADGIPSAVISIEAPGANAVNQYHNAIGRNVTDLEAKLDVLFEKLQDLGVLNIAIGDLGNEIGMGTIKEHIETYIPYTRPNECACECKGGILAKTKADHIITATVSDWGCYGLIAAIAYLKRNLEIFHDGELEKDVMTVASRSGMIDMTGSLTPGIDGFGIKMNATIVDLMRECITYPLKLEETCATWFSKVIEKKFYER